MRTDAAHLIVGVLALVGCGKPMANLDGAVPSDGVKGDGAPIDAPGHTPGMPGLGVHAMNDYHVGANSASSITVAMATQQTGSTVVVGVGRGDNTLFALPTDNKGNTPYQQQGPMRPYNHPYENSGTAVYSFTSAKGGSDFKVSTTTGVAANNNYDEITLAAVEIIEGTRIHAFEWNVVSGAPLTSNSVTTTGPATLITFWWGDAFPGTPQSAIANNGFTVVETNAQERDSFVQCAVAVKNVATAGTYNVTWTADPPQGAQMWLIAVQ